MEKQSGSSREKELLRSLEELVDSKDSDQIYANSFLGFCSRLLSIRPKADTDFRLSLQQDLLKKHPAYLEKKVNAPLLNKFNMLKNMMRGLSAMEGGELPTKTRVKRFAFGSVPALAIVLALIIAIGNSRVDIARAMEILESDPQISAVIERYDLKVQHVEMRSNLGYIFLDSDPGIDDVEVTIIVDLNRETVWKIVAQESKIMSKDEITGYLDGKEAYWAKKKKEFAAEAERLGMTSEEYMTHLKKEGAAKFEEKAAARGMTPGEYKTYLADEKAAKVEAYLAEFAAKAESMGMTVEEYKAYLTEIKEAKKTKF